MSLLTVASRAALDLLFPPRCALCRRSGDMVCAACANSLPPADGARCARCWVPAARGGPCRHCLAVPPAFASLRSAFVMDGGARRLAHELKYEGMTALAEPMARLMLEAVAPVDADVVVPVPLHRGRERSRGYNQSAELGRHVAASGGLGFDPRAARRIRATVPLVKAMSRDERLAIMRGAFSADRRRVEGRTIVLVDDVATTGATLDACAEALLDAGAARVRALTWARAD